MTTVYRFKFGWTKLGLGTVPSAVPTVIIEDVINNVLLVSGSTLTQNIIGGGYRYSYTGTDQLNLYAKASTTDASMDQQDLFALPDITLFLISNVDVPVSSRMVSGTVLVGDKTGFSLATPQNFNLVGNISGTQVGNIQGNLLGYVGMVTGSAMSLVSGTSGGGTDSLLNAVPGAYGAGTAGYVLGTNLDMKISGRMASGTVMLTAGQLNNLDVPVSSRLATGSLSNLDAPISSRQPTGTNFAGLIYLDAPISSRLPTGTANFSNLANLDVPISSRLSSGTLLNLDVPISSRLPTGTLGNLDVPVSSRMPTGTSFANLSNLDVLVSSRMPTGSLSYLDVPVSSRQPTGTVTVIQSQLANLDVPISSRMPTGTSFANLSNLDVPVSSRQPTGTNLAGLIYLDAPISSRMPTGSLGYLDVPVSSRMATGTTVITSLPTGTNLSYLDVPVSSRMPTGTTFSIPTGTVFYIPTGTILISYVTLGQPSVQMLSALQGTIINAVRHDTLLLQFSNLGSLAGRTKLYFTVKSSPDDDDTQSEIQIEESGGLLYIDQTVGVAAKGSLVVTDALLGNITVTLDASEMSKLDIGKYTYDVKIIRAGAIPVTTLTMNVFNVVSDSTWSVI